MTGKRGFRKRALSLVLSVFLVFGMIPIFSPWQAAEATEAATPEAVTIEEGAAPEAPVADESTAIEEDGTQEEVSEEVAEDEAVIPEDTIPEVDAGTVEVQADEIEAATSELANELDYNEVQYNILRELENDPSLTYIEDEIIVVFKSPTSFAQANSLLSDQKTLNLQSVSENSQITDEAVLIKLTEGQTVYEAAKSLGKNPHVAYVQPNFTFEYMVDTNAAPTEATADATSAIMPKDLLTDLGIENNFDIFGGLEADDAVDNSKAAGLSAFGLDDLGEIVNSAQGVDSSIDPGEAIIVEDGMELSIDEDLALMSDEEADIAEEVTGGFDAQVDSELQVATGTNDSYRGYQWSTINTMANYAWTLVRTNKKVAVAVMDSGVDTGHPDLDGNVIPGTYYDASGSGRTGDTHGHGTHVAGIIAAEANNGVGIAGVSWNAGIIPIKVAGPNDAPNLAYIVRAYQYLLSDANRNGRTLAQETNCRVVNISIGGNGGPNAYPLMNSWISRANGAGIMTVVSAGNVGEYGSPSQYPASYPTCFAVAALKEGSVLNDVVDSYSNRNSYVAISAPGSDILSTYPRNKVSNTNVNGYHYMGGTSMASPFVAGVAAMMFAINPGATPATVRSTLQVTAKNLGPKGKDNSYGYGEINPYQAARNISRTSISNSAPVRPGYKITCRAQSTLPMATSWSWSVLAGPGTITSGGILTPTNSGSIRIKATYRSDSSVYATKVITVLPSSVTLSYSTHVENVGWQPFVGVGRVSGTSGRSLRLEGLRMNLRNNTGISGYIQYQTHVQGIGWQNAVTISSNGNTASTIQGGLSGTSGRALRLEALKIRFTGNLASRYDIYYRVHAENVGWMGWAKNAESAGTAGHSLRLEALQIAIVAKGARVPANNYGGVTTPANTPRMVDPSILGSSLRFNSSVHVENLGNVRSRNSNGNTIVGTTGRALRVEAVNFALAQRPYSGGLQYATHVQGIGWQAPKAEGQGSGTSGRALRLEALRIKLTGNMASRYDVYYRTHIQGFGWTGWAKNAQSCGSSGFAYRMEAMQIAVVPKNSVAPGLNSGYFYAK